MYKLLRLKLRRLAALRRIFLRFLNDFPAIMSHSRFYGLIGHASARSKAIGV